MKGCQWRWWQPKCVTQGCRGNGNRCYRPTCLRAGTCWLHASGRRKYRGEKWKKNRAHGCVVRGEHSSLVIWLLKMKEKIEIWKKMRGMPREASPSTRRLFLKWGEEHSANWPEDNSILCQSQGIQIYFSLRENGWIWAFLWEQETSVTLGTHPRAYPSMACRLPALLICLIWWTVFHFALKKF